MCGITGVFDTRSTSEIDRNLLHRMNETLIHRGPDEGEVYVESGLGLGHRRLSIMDVSSGQQPLFNEDGSVVVVFNGEIYNFQKLVGELTALGHRFRTHCDTEVIVHAWEEWGERCVERFSGMFAFGVWDRNRQTLFMARDRLGIKPFYYTLLDNGLFLFASELKALLVHPDFDKTFDHRAIEDYFAYGYIPEPKTIFKNAFKLNPGHLLSLQRGQQTVQSREYWDIPFTPHGSLSEEEAAEELILRLRNAVDSHLMSEVPLGAFLSGGVDSSAVVAMMGGLMKEPVNTCSIAFADPAFDESDYARLVAERYQTRHFTEQVQQDDFDLIDRLAALYDEPFADSSAIPTYRVCELARKRVTVALSGDGGDENFAGYRRYRWHMIEERLRSKLPLGLRKPLFGLLGSVYPKADWAPKFLRAKTTFESLARDSVEGYFHSVSILDNKLRMQLFTRDFYRDLQGYRAVEVLRDYADKSPTKDALSLIQYLDMKTYLVGDILTKVDRASMAHSLEVRVPLLDHELVEWVSGLPASMKLRQQEGKYILKRSLEPYLPNEVLYRNKMGFSVPLASWFRGPLRERVRTALLGNTLAGTGIFDMGFIRKMLDQHQSGRRDYSAPIWTLLMFEAFMRNTFIDTGHISGQNRAGKLL
ncbi:MAG TPA: amidotransferase 1, exosortase A system-associated [Nitrosomonas europaea]|uniref:XrtA/PEP-CTERM system amidotransferase n=1 Tax=Nitrosomonas europaea TaxID=915 RepID=UPI002492EFE2|nr:XrtA/PEP-CTERM system amidotransferase [Nitrosomonas europaea]HRN82190.1 amidotransferase 1, exosortase A system-associated [Nitrosomonas europaea]HRO56940.1 amidotransferase 1, exosortase A system-associated [Nitrosomonas europaea]HRQ08664.1 amidotransferase 1, exosortase A system-associated [Nitrosomonas europaea]HUM74467.1 amidotransferase 1, exosortase A system-associated [Nitrosomonas europaea]